MIITEEFLDKILGHENLQKYRDGNVVFEMLDHVREFAYTLVGLDHLAALGKLSNQMKSEELISLAKRNEYVELFRALSGEVDYGFAVGETVRYSARKTGPILKIRGGEAVFRDSIVPLAICKKVAKVEPKTVTEQLSLGF